MLPSKLFLALLLVVPSFSLITPLPNKFNAVSTSRVKTTRSTNLLSLTATASSDGESGKNAPNVTTDALPRELMPITLGVFAQMLGEGISLSSLPLYLTRLGARPTSVGLAISCFSLCQMTFAPILVSLSTKVDRSVVLRICLAGAVASSLLIAFSGNVYGIVAGRALAGVFAACVPVAQSAVTDILPKEQTVLGLSRVSAASQLGVVVGPAASAIFQESFAAMGLPAAKCLPAVFCLNSLFTLSVLAQMTITNRKPKISEHEKQSQEAKTSNDETNKPIVEAPKQDSSLRLAQPMLRTITIAMGWTAILSNSIYGLFAPRFLGFSQPQLSATYSVAAALMVGTQVILPKLMHRVGDHNLCTVGILSAAIGIGGQSLVRFQPFHTLLYMVNRTGAAVADTSTATLVARLSENRDARSRNLALLTSTRAAGRIVTPLLSSKLFELSCRTKGLLVPSGALPFVIAAGLATAVAPLPTLLKRAEARMKKKNSK